jgi:hypothetical protein
VRLAAIGLLAVGVAVTLYVVGRLHTPNYTISLFGGHRAGRCRAQVHAVIHRFGPSPAAGPAGPVDLPELPLAGPPPRPVRLAHRVIGFGLFALTVPIAVHALLAYGVQLTSLGVAVHSLAVVSSTAPCREGAARSEQAAAGLGTAGCRGSARRRCRRALVHLGAVVLQRLPTASAVRILVQPTGQVCRFRSKRQPAARPRQVVVLASISLVVGSPFGRGAITL